MTDPNAALAALNAVLFTMRELARDGGSSAELVEWLDWAEYLPRLMAAPDDRTAEFRTVLQHLAASREDFQLAVDRFDAPPAKW